MALRSTGHRVGAACRGGAHGARPGAGAVL